jgi:hypothetical protein
VFCYLWLVGHDFGHGHGHGHGHETGTISRSIASVRRAKLTRTR